jgi:predicted nucleic acid-binding protein
LTTYADTSFLVSLYTPDANSRPAAELMRTAKLPVLITPLGELELTNALRLRIFRNELSSAQVKAASTLFRKDLEAGIFTVSTMPANTYESAKRISRRHTSRLGARTLDILHVASAISLHVDTLYTFDKAQRRLAQAERLTTS